MALEWVSVGKKCVCISDFWHSAEINGPHQNEVLTISGNYLNPRGLLNLRFVEYPGWDDGDGGFHGYNVRNFRPFTAQDTDMEMFRTLLNPTPLERLDRLMEQLNEQ